MKGMAPIAQGAVLRQKVGFIYSEDAVLIFFRSAEPDRKQKIYKSWRRQITAVWFNCNPRLTVCSHAGSRTMKAWASHCFKHQCTSLFPNPILYIPKTCSGLLWPLESFVTGQSGSAEFFLPPAYTNPRHNAGNKLLDAVLAAICLELARCSSFQLSLQALLTMCRLYFSDKKRCRAQLRLGNAGYVLSEADGLSVNSFASLMSFGTSWHI